MNLIISTFLLQLASTKRQIGKRICKHNKSMKIMLTIYLCLSVACFRLVLTILGKILETTLPKQHKEPKNSRRGYWMQQLAKYINSESKLKKLSEHLSLRTCYYARQVTVTGSTVTSFTGFSKQSAKVQTTELQILS
jgi:hypothetical protein